MTLAEIAGRAMFDWHQQANPLLVAEYEKIRPHSKE